MNREALYKDQNNRNKNSYCKGKGRGGKEYLHWKQAARPEMLALVLESPALHRQTWPNWVEQPLGEKRCTRMLGGR